MCKEFKIVSVNTLMKNTEQMLSYGTVSNAVQGGFYF